MAPIRRCRTQNTTRCRTCVICKKIFSLLNDDKRTTTFPLDEDRCKQCLQIIGNEDLAYIPREKLHEMKYKCGDTVQSQDFNDKKSRLNKSAIPLLINVQPLSDHTLAEFPCHIAKSDQEPNETYYNSSDVDISTIPWMASETIPSRCKRKPTLKVYKGFKKTKEIVSICRTCLATNVNMYKLCELTTFSAYTQLTGVQDLGLYPYICYECAARLRKSEEFRSNCLKALETLSNKQIPEEIEADRELKGLKSPLQVQVLFEAFECRDTEIYNQIDEVGIINENNNDENCKKQKYIESHDHTYAIRNVFAENRKRKIDQTKKKEQNSDKLKFPLKLYAKITIMTPEEAKREVDKRKQTRNYKESPFKCNLCYRGFFMKSLYDDHMKKHTMASGIYECEFCFLRFPKINIKKIHFAEFHKVKIFCKTCPFICFNPSLAKTHIMKSHNTLKYTCDKCPVTFSEPSSLHSHKRLSHPTSSACSFCGDTFLTDKGLKFHISRTHKQQILKDIETNHKIKDSQSPMQLQVLGSNELKISDEVEIAVESINQYYNNENNIIQELFEFDTHESDAVEEQDVTIENDKPEFDQTLTLAEYLSSYKCFENDELNLPLIIDLEEHATIIKFTPEEAKCEVDKRKESKNYKESLYKCNLCYRGFLRKNTHANHMKKHSETSGEYLCKFCFIRFPKKITRRKHIENCHKLKIYCKKCPRVFTSKFKAKHHMMSHEGVKYKCDECPKSFRFKNSICSHKRLNHPKTLCAFCGDSFVNDYGLKLHIAISHKQEQNEESRLGPSCVECNVHFATETAWKRHLVLSEKHRVSNGCKICGERFANKLELRSHMLTHGDDTRLRPQRIQKPCPVCNGSFSSTKMYCMHMKSEHPDSEYTKLLKTKRNTFVCEFCGKSFARHVSLEDHVNTHTKESSYKCKVCEKRFFSSGSYYIHQRNVHNSNKSFQCDLCGKAYKAKFSLEIHMKRTHLNILEHECHICGKAFVLPSEVKYHKQHVHGDVPWPKRDRSKRNQDNNH